MTVAEGRRRLLRFDRFELDTRAGELRNRGRKVRLQDKPLRLLEVLLEHPGEVVTRDELRQRLWSDDTFVDFDAGLNTAVNKMRTALGDSAEKPQFVETVGRRGYRFVGALEPVGDPIDAVSAAEPVHVVSPLAEQPAARRHRHHLLPLTAAALVVVATVAWLALRSRTPASPSIRSLAVLPLANLSGDPQQEYFAEGMTDALITNLASIHALRVISRQSVMRFKGSNDPLPAIARQLGVDAVIEGSVVRSGGRVRVTAQLIHAPTDRHLWARSYDRAIGDVLGLQGELARTIADEVRVQVTSEERRRLAGPRPVGTEAYDAYLRGRHFWARRDKEGLTKAVGYFERAIAADPAFALAYAGLAETYGPLGYSAFLPPSEATPRMKAAALKAVELDPDLAEAHTAMAACLAFHEWQWSPAEGEFQRAIELNPGYTTARAWYALYLHSIGRDEEALGQNMLALKNDPLSLNANMNAAGSLSAVGRKDEAIEQYRKTLELDSRFYRARVGLAEDYAATGRPDQALAEMRQADADAGGVPPTRAALGHLHATLGRVDEARTLLAEITERSRTEYVSPMDRAVLHADLGEKDAAFGLLERAYEQRVPALSRIKTTGLLKGLRSDPRFDDLLRRMKLL